MTKSKSLQAVLPNAQNSAKRLLVDLVLVLSIGTERVAHAVFAVVDLEVLVLVGSLFLLVHFMALDGVLLHSLLSVACR
jgi:hypothetical protein